MKRLFRAHPNGEVEEIVTAVEERMVLSPLPTVLGELASTSLSLYDEVTPRLRARHVFVEEPEEQDPSAPRSDRSDWVSVHNASVLARLAAEAVARGKAAVTANTIEWKDLAYDPDKKQLVITRGGQQYKACTSCENYIPLQWFSALCYECLRLQDHGGEG